MKQHPRAIRFEKLLARLIEMRRILAATRAANLEALGRPTQNRPTQNSYFFPGTQPRGMS